MLNGITAEKVFCLPLSLSRRKHLMPVNNMACREWGNEDNESGAQTPGYMFMH
jgi:hypothetical protein